MIQILILVFETGSHYASLGVQDETLYVAQTNLGLTVILLPQLPEC